MRTCKTCFEQKPLEDFYRDKGLPAGRSNNCKVCKNKKTESWREAHRDKYNQDMRTYRKNNIRAVKSTLLKKSYGVSLEQYEQRLAEQGNVCGICQKPNKSTKRMLAMDHNHKTGAARGVLCYGCNRSLHMLDHDGLLEKAQAYLRKWS